MADRINDKMIDSIGILAKLELTGEERQEAKQDIGKMLDYVDKLQELDTSGVPPMRQLFSTGNVFREDVVTNQDKRDEMLANAPEVRDGFWSVPKTVE